MGMIKIIRIGVVCLLLSALLFTSILAADGMSVFWFWFSAAFYMLGFGILGPSATSIALDPVPEMAGRAAAILGTVQLLTGMLFSLLAALLYDGTMNILVALIVVSSISATWIAFNYRYRPV
jgi:DHA1 family bicyclomycin/chloramphenicol resistance-like MFS transporter